MHGMIRIVMKPLITSVPLIGGVQIFFLDQPKIDFELTGVADLLEMPGIRYIFLYYDFLTDAPIQFDLASVR